MPQTKRREPNESQKTIDGESEENSPRKIKTSRRKMTDEEDQHLVRYNRPITRAYQKILDQIDQERANLISQGYCSMSENEY